MILLAMAIGAGIGALAGAMVYGAKVAISKQERFSWKALAAHAVGGLVGGGLFPAVFAGLGALGVPAAGAYVLAGGIAWGGIWTLAQDAASWGLGLTRGLGGVRKYLTATAVGLAATALLLPFASRAVGPGMQLARHSGSAQAFLLPSKRALAANVAKSEAEFLAFGALSETAGAVTRHTLRRSATALARGGVVEGTTAGATRGVTARATAASGAVAAPAHGGQGPPPLTSATEESVSSDAGVSPFGAFAHRVHERVSAAAAPSPGPSEQTGSGCVDALERALGE